MKQLSGMDAFFVNSERETAPMHVATLLVYEPSCPKRRQNNLARVRAILTRRLQNSPVFRRRLYHVRWQLDNPWWVDDDTFELDRHLKHASLGCGSTRKDLNQLLADLHKHGLDMRRPLWELCVIDGLGNLPEYPQGAYGLYVKVHHAAIDGVAGMEIIAAINELDPKSIEPPMDRWTAKDTSPPMWEVAWRTYQHNARRTLESFQVLSSLAPQFAGKPRASSRTNDAAAHPKRWLRTPLARTVGPERVIETVQFDLAEFRAVRRLLPRLTMNHVFLTGIGAALRRYLSGRGELPNASLSTAVPVNVRQRGDASEGNKISVALCTLHTEIADPARHLEAVRDAAIEAQHRARELGRDILSRLTDLATPTINRVGVDLLRGATGIAGGLPMPVQTVCSNVPGPQTTLYLQGDRLVDMQVFGLILDGIGLFHSLNTYNGKLTISVLASPRTLEDPECYRSCIEQSFAELIELAKQRSAHERDYSRAA